MITKPLLAEDNAIVAHGGWQHTASSAYEDSGTSSVRYEHRLYKNLWIGPEYTYHGPVEHHTGQDDGTRFDYGNISGHSLLLDVIYYPEWVNVKNIQAYTITGAGWSLWDFAESNGVKDLEIMVDLGDAFAYKFGAGVVYPINDDWSFLVEWSFFKASIPKDAYEADGSYSAILGDDKASGRVRIGEEETRLTFGLKYSW